MHRLALLSLSSMILVACGGGGGGGGSGLCHSMNTSRANVTESCTGCTISDPPAVADGNANTAADVEFTGANQTISITVGSGGHTFPAGSEAGAFITQSLPQVVSNATSLQTSSGETATGPALTSEAAPGGTDASRYVHFTTTQPFDSLTITFSITGNSAPSASDVRIYELCGDD